MSNQIYEKYMKAHYSDGELDKMLDTTLAGIFAIILGLPVLIVAVIAPIILLFTDESFRQDVGQMIGLIILLIFICAAANSFKSWWRN